MLTVGDSVQIQGCSTKKRILETSSGCDSFDTLCGGALTNSSIVLIDEYRSRHYASYLVKYFLAEGVYHKHKCVVIDPCNDVDSTLLKSIPSRKLEKPSDDRPAGPSPFPPSKSEEDMKIAWRYGSIAKVDSSLSSNSKSENVYDFANPVDSESVDVEILKSTSLDGSYSFKDVYEQIQKIIQKEDAHTKGGGRGGPKKNLLRIVIQNIDSGLWKDSNDLPRFLVLIRALIRSSYAIVYLTANSYSVEELEWRKIESMADCHVQLIGFDEQEKKTFRHLGNVHGYFRLKNLPRLASLGTHTPPILDLIFEAQSRKGFQIRIMHLPPALDDPAPAAAAKPNCSKFDF